MKTRSTMTFLTLCLAALASACLWDYDTVAMEAKGLPKVIDVIAGRFDRNPDLFYEMRLERATNELESDPEDLIEYGNVAVSLDKLGRSDEAIPFLEDRLAVLTERGDTTSDHLYQIYANLGTVRVHHWIKSGAPAEDLAPLEQAISEIEKALEINPDAHFGREFVQLHVMNLLLLDKQNPDDKSEPAEYHEKFICAAMGEDADKQQEDILDGLVGMIVMGGGWNSSDIFNVLGGALNVYEFAALSEMADMRASSLRLDGASTLFSEELTDGIKLKMRGSSLSPLERNLSYGPLEENGIEYDSHRTEFMLTRLEQGRHPDTDAKFWDGYSEVERVEFKIYNRTLKPWYLRQTTKFAAGVGLAIASVIGLYIWSNRRKRAKASEAA